MSKQKPQQSADLPAIANATIEEKFIACVLFCPGSISQYMEFPPSAFHIKSHQLIWRAMLDLACEGKTPDMTNVASGLSDAGISISDAMSMISVLVENSMVYQPEFDDTRFFYQQAYDLYQKRRLDEFSYRLRTAIRQPGSEWKNSIPEEITAIFQDRPVGEHTQKTIREIMATPPPKCTLFSTGLQSLDDFWAGGMRGGELITVCARTSHGKSTFCNWLAKSVAEKGYKVAIASVEMTDRSVVHRLISSYCNVAYSYLQILETEHADRFQKCYSKVEHIADLISIDSQSSTLDSIICGFRAKILEGNVGLLIVDHIHELVNGADNEAIAKAAGAVSTLKRLANQLNIPVVMAAQINRSAEHGTNKRPTTAGIRQFGSIEEKSDKVVGLYREEMVDKTSVDQGITEVITLKNRNGATGTVKLLSDVATNQYFDMPQGGTDNEF